MRSFRRFVLVSTLLLAAVGRADAQVLSRFPLALQARAGAGLPIGGFAEGNPGIGAEPGAAWEIGGILQPVSWLGVYAAYRQDRFGCAECSAVGVDEEAVANGVEAGGQLWLPFERFGVRPWVRGGVVRHSLRFARGESGLRSEPGVGFGAGAGVELAVAGLRLAPGVHYRSYPAEVRFTGHPARSLDVSHLTVDLGLILPF